MNGNRRLLSTAVLGAAVAAAVLGVAAPAQAHDAVVASVPTEGAVLTELPAEFSITANQTYLDLVGDGTGFGIVVTDAAGRYYGDGCVSIVDATMSTPASLGEAGDYTLTYQYVSSDSHPTSGSIAFSWAPPAGAQAATGSETAPVCGVASEEPAAEPDPTMTTQAVEPSPEATTTAAEPDSSATLLWIGGAGAAVVAAVVVTLLLVRT